MNRTVIFAAVLLAVVSALFWLLPSSKNAALPPPQLAHEESPPPSPSSPRKRCTALKTFSVCENATATSDTLGALRFDNSPRVRIPNGDPRCVSADQQLIDRVLKSLSKSSKSSRRQRCVANVLSQAKRRFHKRSSSTISINTTAANRLRVTVTFALNATKGTVYFEEERTLLLHTWLLHARPGRDELHFVTDHAVALTERMVRALRMAIFRQKKMKQNSPTTQQIDQVVADVRVLDTRSPLFAESARPQRPQDGTNMRAWVFAHYLEHVVENIAAPRPLGAIIAVDMRDTVFQENPQDALEEMDFVSAPEFVLAVREVDLLADSAQNLQWVSSFLGNQATATLVSTSGVHLPVACSGLLGGSRRALAVLASLMSRLLDCAPGRHGLDQGAAQTLFYYGLRSVRVDFPFLLLDQNTGPFRHMIPRSRFASWPRSENDKKNPLLLNMCGRPYAIVHQGDRHPAFWGPLMFEALSAARTGGADDDGGGLNDGYAPYTGRGARRIGKEDD